MLNKFLTRKTILCISAFVLLIIVAISASNISGSIKYDAGTSSNSFQFFYDNLVFGNSELGYAVRNPNITTYFTRSTDAYVKGIINIEVHGLPIIIISIILSLLISIGAIVISIRVMDINKKKNILIVLGFLLAICSIFLFLTSAFSKKLMIDTANDVFGRTANYERFSECKTRGSVWCGFLTMIASCLVFASAFATEKTIWNESKTLCNSEINK